MSVNRPVDRLLTVPVDRFFTEGFCSLFNCSLFTNEKFSKKGGMGKVLKFVTPNESLRKKRKIFFFSFWQKSLKSYSLIPR